MAAINIEAFGGMIPGIDSALLPPAGSSEAQNLWLYDGKLRGWRIPRLVHVLADPTTRMVYRIPQAGNVAANISSSWWLEFLGVDTSVIKSPVKEQTDPTYYFAGNLPPAPPRYTSQARIEASNPDLILGIPAPTDPLTVAPAGGAATELESRVYVYTLVSSYGEEGPPSPPSALTTGKVDDTWVVTIPSNAAYLPDRDLTKARIYRTITSDQGIATFFFVAEVNVADTTYNDTITSDVIALNEELESANFDAPPTDLEGFATMPNGMVIGWVKQQIWFCEPYRPHAWPASYQIAVDNNIVGIGVVGQTAVICTEGAPYTCTGNHPAAMTLARITATPHPCTSQGSIVSTPDGVYYCAEAGLVRVSPGGADLLTKDMMQRDDWQRMVNTSRLHAATLNGAYYCYSGVGEGFVEPTAFEPTAFEQVDYTGTRSGAVIEFTNPRLGLVRLLSDTPVYNVVKDQWTDEILIIMGDSVYHVDTSAASPEGDYLWRSRIYRSTYPLNYGVFRVNYIAPPLIPDGDKVQGIFRVYGDGNLVYEVEIVEPSATPQRLPAGVRYATYQFEVEGNLQVRSVQIATSMKELKGL